MMLGALLVSGITLPARASIYGSLLSWQYYVYGEAYVNSAGQTSGTFVANGGIGGVFSDGGTTYFKIIADSTSITFDYSTVARSDPWSDSGLSLAPTIYNGIAIDLVSGPAFAGVTIDPASNMNGFDTSRFSFTPSQIQVDWHNLVFGPQTIVKLDIVTVPEPQSASLLAFILAAPLVRKLRKGI